MYKAGEKYLSYYEDLESNLEKRNYIGATKDIMVLSTVPGIIGLAIEFYLYVFPQKS